MRDQGDFKSGVKRFAYDGSKSPKNNATDDWDSYSAQKPNKKTKEFEELKDIWSIQKNVSLTSMPLKPQGNTVQAPPTGTGFYSRHGQHNPGKISEGMRTSPNTNQLRNSFPLNQRSGYSYSQPEAQSSVTKLPQLAPGPGTSRYQSQGRYGDATQYGGSSRSQPGSGVSSPRTSLGMPKPSQHFGGSQHLGGNNRTSGAGSQWPSL